MLPWSVDYALSWVWSGYYIAAAPANWLGQLVLKRLVMTVWQFRSPFVAISGLLILWDQRDFFFVSFNPFKDASYPVTVKPPSSAANVDNHTRSYPVRGFNFEP